MGLSGGGERWEGDTSDTFLADDYVLVCWHVVKPFADDVVLYLENLTFHVKTSHS